MSRHGMSYSDAAAVPSATRWELAYQAFETPEEEVRKFVGRLRGIGADAWNRRSRIVEICSGRGSGLRAWHSLGFHDVVGVDLSPALVAAHTGPGHCVLGDARCLPLARASRDVAIVQGGLHHLATFEDVALALAEMRRVVVPDGRVVIIEPWSTPFLRAVHFLTEKQLLRRLIPTVDVAVENAKPGAMEARGFGYSHARAANPRIVWCSITGFGQTGPNAEHAGHDLSYLAHSGLLGALKLGRMVLAHIVATGGIAMTDDLLGQFLGQDILRRLSRRLGEGVFNGALTARIGLAALEVIRPLPFLAGKPPRVRDVLAEVVRPLLTPKRKDA